MRDPSKLLKASAILDVPEHVPAVWGRGDDVLWAEGEPCILAGPPGVGKSSLAQQVALARAGISADLDVLGYLVMPGEGRTLYVAADRPQQVMRSMRRMVEPRHRRLLDEGALLIWPGPFELDDADESLVEFCWMQGIKTVIFDSIKDVAGDTSDGKVGAAFNTVLQSLVSEGIEVMALHHNRKAQEGNRRPKRLDDLYGSTWIAAGAGSVLYLYGEAGDLAVELLHLKQPVAEVGPLTVIHDHAKGVSTVADGTSALDVLASKADGATAKEVAAEMLATAEPNRNQIQKARRRLDKLAETEVVERIPGESETAPVIYRVKRVKQSVKQTHSLHAPNSNGSDKRYGELHALHAEASSSAPPFIGAREADREAGGVES